MVEGVLFIFSHCVFLLFGRFLPVQGQCQPFFSEGVVLLDLGPTLQVLQCPRGGCRRSARSSGPLAGARSGGFLWMSSDPGSRVALRSQRGLAEAAVLTGHP